jgi:hypothetical protein
MYTVEMASTGDRYSVNFASPTRVLEVSESSVVALKMKKEADETKRIAECGGDVDLYVELNKATSYHEERYRYYMACANVHRKKIAQIVANRKKRLKKQERTRLSKLVQYGSRAANEMTASKLAVAQRKTEGLKKKKAKESMGKVSSPSITITLVAKKAVTEWEGLESPTVSVSDGNNE